MARDYLDLNFEERRISRPRRRSMFEPRPDSDFATGSEDIARVNAARRRIKKERLDELDRQFNEANASYVPPDPVGDYMDANPDDVMGKFAPIGKITIHPNGYQPPLTNMPRGGIPYSPEVLSGGDKFQQPAPNTGYVDLGGMYHQWGDNARDMNESRIERRRDAREAARKFEMDKIAAAHPIRPPEPVRPPSPTAYDVALLNDELGGYASEEEAINQKLAMIDAAVVPDEVDTDAKWESWSRGQREKRKALMSKLAQINEKRASLKANRTQQFAPQPLQQATPQQAAPVMVKAPSGEFEEFRRRIKSADPSYPEETIQQDYQEFMARRGG